MKLKIVVLFFFFPLELLCQNPKNWVKSGYWYSGNELPLSSLNSALFTHLIGAFVGFNSTSYKLSIPSTAEEFFSTFSNVVKHKNPSIQTLLSISSGEQASPAFLRMINQTSHRRSFIESSIEMARLYDYNGLDLCCISPTTISDMNNLGLLLDEWRAALESESGKSGKPILMLTMAVHYLPIVNMVSYPIDSMKKNLNWVHLRSYDYYLPLRYNFTAAHAALYDPHSHLNTDFGIDQWVSRGFPTKNLLLGLPFHGYAWKLVDPNVNSFGAPASGPAVTRDGSMSYKLIKWQIQTYGATTVYNATYVVNYCIFGSIWIGFDDVETIQTKISYANQKKLLGYTIFQVPNDDNWILSRAAQAKFSSQGSKRKLLFITLLMVTALILLASFTYYLLRRTTNARGWLVISKYIRSNLGICTSAAEDFMNEPDPRVFSFSELRLATSNFSDENKLGEGGFGQVYKGKLPTGQEIAVKRLSKSSKQGTKEFKNEVSLTAKLQHVNLVRVLGFCTRKPDKMVIYEYMPNKSLNFYLFDPTKQPILDWDKRVHIIEGVIQGLIYLQEYSRLTVVHRDIKPSNILLDSAMKPKISDFGMATIFKKDEHKGNQLQIVGTYGYMSPECARMGVYSAKSDVYSFGVLLLEIISGKRISSFYGFYKNLSLLEYAYELWKNGESIQFMDPSLDDSSSPCKLMRCLQVALLCVQEEPADRPSMLDVSSMIKNDTATIAIPKRPSFFSKHDEDEVQQEICSVNEATGSDILPR